MARRRKRRWRGQRTALNLAGTEAGDLARGMILTDTDRFEVTQRVHTLFSLLPYAPPLKNGARVHFHSGTAELIGKVLLLDETTGKETERKLAPGERGYVQFRLSEPTLLLPGDRFIVRRFSPVITIGGGQVLDNWVPRQAMPIRPPRRTETRKFLKILEDGNREATVRAVLGAYPGGFLRVDDLVPRTGWLPEECREITSRSGRRDTFGSCRSILCGLPTRSPGAPAREVMNLLQRFHKENPLLPGISKEALRSRVLSSHPQIGEAVLRQLVEQKQIVVSGETVRSRAHKIVLKDEEEQSKRQIARAFEQAGLMVPSVRQVLGKLSIEPRRAEKILQMLLQEGALIRVSEDLVFHAEAIRKLLKLLARHKSKSNRITVRAFKDLAQVSRKYAIPLLEYLDRERVTRRAGDERILL